MSSSDIVADLVVPLHVEEDGKRSLEEKRRPDRKRHLRPRPMMLTVPSPGCPFACCFRQTSHVKVSCCRPSVISARGHYKASHSSVFSFVSAEMPSLRTPHSSLSAMSLVTCPAESFLLVLAAEARPRRRAEGRGRPFHAVAA